jgi:sulfatase modifying factor 1
MANRNLNFFLFLLFILTLVFSSEHEVYADTKNSDTQPAVSESLSEKDKADSSEDKYNRMVFVPAGVFRRGSTSDNVTRFYEMCRKADKKCKRWWFKDETPLIRVNLDAFWIDVYEVTNEKYLEFVLATGHRPALDDKCETEKCKEGNLWKGNKISYVIKRQPVTQVSWFDAVSYCEWRGKRLPTESEWEKAARGIKGNVFPWGAIHPKGKATFNRKWRGIITMTDVGIYPAGKSVYGLYDMAGNVWEWVADWYDYKYYKKKIRENPKGPDTGEFKVVRGGSWVNHADSLHSAFRRWSRPEVRFNDTGFRCAKNAEDKNTSGNSSVNKKN